MFSDGNIDEMKWVKFFFWHALSISKSIYTIIINGLTHRPQITDESFFDGLFLCLRTVSVNTDIKFHW
jgi:hypothetical protein